MFVSFSFCVVGGLERDLCVKEVSVYIWVSDVYHYFRFRSHLHHIGYKGYNFVLCETLKVIYDFVNWPLKKASTPIYEKSKKIQSP